MEDNSFVKRQRKDGHAGDKMTKPKFEAINLLGSFDEYEKTATPSSVRGTAPSRPNSEGM
jgi:hypothetical protein